MSTTPSAQYSLTIRVKIDDAHGALGLLTSAIGEAGGMVGAVARATGASRTLAQARGRWRWKGDADRP